MDFDDFLKEYNLNKAINYKYIDLVQLYEALESIRNENKKHRAYSDLVIDECNTLKAKLDKSRLPENQKPTTPISITQDKNKSKRSLDFSNLDIDNNKENNNMENAPKKIRKNDQQGLDETPQIEDEVQNNNGEQIIKNFINKIENDNANKDSKELKNNTNSRIHIQSKDGEIKTNQKENSIELSKKKPLKRNKKEDPEEEEEEIRHHTNSPILSKTNSLDRKKTNNHSPSYFEDENSDKENSLEESKRKKIYEKDSSTKEDQDLVEETHYPKSSDTSKIKNFNKKNKNNKVESNSEEETSKKENSLEKSKRKNIYEKDSSTKEDQDLVEETHYPKSSDTSKIKNFNKKNKNNKVESNSEEETSKKENFTGKLNKKKIDKKERNTKKDQDSENETRHQTKSSSSSKIKNFNKKNTYNYVNSNSEEVASKKENIPGTSKEKHLNDTKKSENLESDTEFETDDVKKLSKTSEKKHPNDKARTKKEDPESEVEKEGRYYKKSTKILKTKNINKKTSDNNTPANSEEEFGKIDNSPGTSTQKHFNIKKRAENIESDSEEETRNDKKFLKISKKKLLSKNSKKPNDDSSDDSSDDSIIENDLQRKETRHAMFYGDKTEIIIKRLALTPAEHMNYVFDRKRKKDEDDLNKDQLNLMKKFLVHAVQKAVWIIKKVFIFFERLLPYKHYITLEFRCWNCHEVYKAFYFLDASKSDKQPTKCMIITCHNVQAKRKCCDFPESDVTKYETLKKNKQFKDFENRCKTRDFLSRSDICFDLKDVKDSYDESQHRVLHNGPWCYCKKLKKLLE